MGARSVVTSDKHKGYLHLNEICRHYSVNHSVEFKTTDGHHTNLSEGMHSVIKRQLIEQHKHYGESTRALRKNIALQTVRYGSGKKSGGQEWAERLRSILLVVRDFYSTDVVDLVTISQDSIPENAHAVAEVTQSATTLGVKLTKKGLPDKRSSRASSRASEKEGTQC